MDNHISSKWHKYVGCTVTAVMHNNDTLTGKLEYNKERGKYMINCPYISNGSETGYYGDGCYLFRKSHVWIMVPEGKV